MLYICVFGRNPQVQSLTGLYLSGKIQVSTSSLPLPALWWERMCALRTGTNETGGGALKRKRLLLLFRFMDT